MRIASAERHFTVEIPLGYSFEEPADPPQVAVVCHIFHPMMAAEIRSYLRNIPFPADIFLSTDTEEKRKELEAVFAAWDGGSVRVDVVPNRGRDIAPKLVGFDTVHDRYEYVLHLHSKMATYEGGLWTWRGYIFETLLGSPEIVRNIFEIFYRIPRLGFIAPQHFEPIRKLIGWGSNFEAVREIARQMGLFFEPTRYLDFPSGSMFWARSAALKPLRAMKLSFETFPEERGQRDGTLAHAIERLFFMAGEKAGYAWLHVGRREFFRFTESILQPRDAAEVKDLLAVRGRHAAPTKELVRLLEANPDYWRPS